MLRYLKSLKINKEISFWNPDLKEKDTRNDKYLKGLQYTYINRTETKKLIHNDQSIFSTRHLKKSEEEMKFKKITLEYILK